MVDLTLELALKTPNKLIGGQYEINWQQTYRGVRFYVGWMIGTLV